MEIRTVAFESELIITLENNQKVVITPFKTQEPGNFKLGIDAPKQVTVNRQEIYLRKQEQLNRNKKSTSTES
ncbi:carbon storage regulator [Legionella pneumophila]|uniref:carbon storage regulator n=1 Tax=Legionella pneumophila TaxID=446 RepID=UPI0007707302|nr:carbon storage regulator [Legionella pneumophila]HAT8826461.1 carbon storage regulator CsrA [Legionella pneumophila subsp. pneumophila]AOU50697.1 carbon storage regulator CsrA [Legionella pneumophila]AOU62548.1 carbon storage regulator CsrA [Legionella pneumophila]AOU71557.1 carbon storage regulator CsrA [Legionella pneumophila]MCW8390950.1 carbon storage regulator [Legionella pneumophila]